MLGGEAADVGEGHDLVARSGDGHVVVAGGDGRALPAPPAAQPARQPRPQRPGAGGAAGGEGAAVVSPAGGRGR